MPARLLERHVAGGVAYEQEREEEGDDGDRGAEGDKNIARGELGRQPAGEPGGACDAPVAGRLIEAQRQPAAAGAGRGRSSSPRSWTRRAPG
jgi:hypothetical protein